MIHFDRTNTEMVQFSFQVAVGYFNGNNPHLQLDNFGGHSPCDTIINNICCSGVKLYLELWIFATRAILILPWTS